MSSSDCNSVRSHLSAYHDGELSAGQAATVAKHIESCESCAAELRAFESIGSAFAQTQMPAKPSDLWQRIERELPMTAEAVTLSKRFGVWVRESPYGAGLVSMAASVLVLLGAGLWYGGNNGDMAGGGAMAMHGSDGHSHDGEMSAEHMAEFAGVMDEYLQKLPSDPDAAERMLLAKYNGEKVDTDGAVKLVGYRPIVSSGLPEGYSLASTSVLKMPCCTCVKAVCKRSDGSTLVLFEHDDEETAWFGDRRQSMATCGDKDCCLVDLDSSIAATWKQGTRSVTAVGVRDQEEVAKLVTWLDKS
ncbi:anti-sigma factor family protein [Neorhodopirellula lusitana]|uniref:anti-sigma factor family protein n=1 Tax=Neorhodopirellula lusitana TaxID=445327 RepID=UPI0038512270